MKILNDLDDARKNYEARITSINKDMTATIHSLSKMENSLDFLDDNKANVEVKMTELTHYKLNLKKYESDSDRFRYKMVILIILL